jgi:hypothetical protein
MVPVVGRERSAEMVSPPGDETMPYARSWRMLEVQRDSLTCRFPSKIEPRKKMAVVSVTGIDRWCK